MDEVMVSCFHVLHATLVNRMCPVEADATIFLFQGGYSRCILIHVLLHLCLLHVCKT